MMDIKPEYANVIRDNKTQRVDPDEVGLGEIIEIRPGERVPLDATIIKGETSLDKLGADYIDLYLIHWPVFVAFAVRRRISSGLSPATF